MPATTAEYQFTFDKVPAAGLRHVAQRFEKAAAEAFGLWGSGTNSVPMNTAIIASQYNRIAETLES